MACDTGPEILCTCNYGCSVACLIMLCGFVFSVMIFCTLLVLQVDDVNVYYVMNSLLEKVCYCSVERCFHCSFYRQFAFECRLSWLLT
jgi:hypothetical protein